MSSLLDLLGSQLDPGAVRQISRQIGASESQTQTAVSAALPLLLGALAKNTGQPTGAESLLGALSRDHDGSILDNLGGFLGVAQEGPGAGILRHVLGQRQGAVSGAIGRASGLDPQAASRLLATLAPILMGALGRVQRQQKLDAGGLADLLGSQRRQIESRSPGAAGILGSLLDTDGDGDVDAADLARHGTGLLGGLFGKR